MKIKNLALKFYESYDIYMYKKQISNFTLSQGKCREMDRQQ